MLARRKPHLLGMTAVLMFTSACAVEPSAAAARLEMMPVAPAQIMPLPTATPLAEMSIAPPADAELLRARYGAPNFVRREMDSELWRYDNENCMVFFFLYRDGPALKVRYVESAPRGAQMPADPLCIQKLNARSGAMF